MRHTTTRVPTALIGSIAVTAVLALSACGGSTAKDDPENSAETPTVTPTESSSATETATSAPTESSSPSTDTTTREPIDESAAPGVGVYFLAKGPRGPKLFSYPTEVASTSPADVLAGLTQTPGDPDYSSVWPADSIVDASVDGKKATVEVSADAVAPAGVNAARGALGLQQVVWTLKENSGVRAVSFTVDGKPATRVLGVALKGAVKPADFFDTISQVRVDTPLEGAIVSGSFVASGANNGFEATLGWQLLDSNGKVVKQGHATAEGWGEKLYPWQTTVKLKGLPDGDYTFRAFNDDPSGGEGGGGPEEDTRTITVNSTSLSPGTD